VERNDDLEAFWLNSAFVSFLIKPMTKQMAKPKVVLAAVLPSCEMERYKENLIQLKWCAFQDCWLQKWSSTTYDVIGRQTDRQRKRQVLEREREKKFASEREI